jgi:flagellar assembly factor FliW
VVTGYGHEESTRIILNVRSMSVHELLDLVVYNPFFLTDAYYVEIGRAVRSRYAELKSPLVRE